jgi:hypothetical protein
MRELKFSELHMVSGSTGPVGAAGGAIVGTAAYVGSTIGSGNGSVGGAINAAAAGAAVGFFLGPASAIGVIGGAELSFNAGLVGGFAERAYNAAQEPAAAPSGLNYCGTGY